MIKKLIKKLYYKFYPEQISDYDKEPNGLLWRNDWNCINRLICEVVIPHGVYYQDDPDILIAAAKRHALSEWSGKIKDNMFVVTEYEPCSQKYHIRVSLNIYEPIKKEISNNA